MSESGRAYPAPAKLNLSLRVTGRRADGYHLLQTVFRFIDFGDTLRFTMRADGVIARVNELPGVAEADDLTLRAARLLQKAGAVRQGADITLEKRLPLGGGLGGGSSDAATTLIVLNRLWGLDWPRARLQELALELGADVPVFVFGESALGQGIGEKLTALALPPAWYLVLIPPVAVATARVFQDPDLIRDSIPTRIPPFSPALAVNDLEPVVCRLYPAVAQHLDWLKQFGRARMTGSGACVFAEFSTEAEARAILGRLPATMRGEVAAGLTCHPLRDAVGC
ncbi:MAG: 4-(cytidine 5'-diphospho)-2-C-methyl-D-erythritol kinase [Betaproteobacteria bacterium]|nr:4-(cytidine 5'-diphospho)-2-C-methyl-D-erythritol kinase [Betaproteobacteria bacterium]